MIAVEQDSSVFMSFGQNGDWLMTLAICQTPSSVVGISDFMVAPATMPGLVRARGAASWVTRSFTIIIPCWIEARAAGAYSRTIFMFTPGKISSPCLNSACISWRAIRCAIVCSSVRTSPFFSSTSFVAIAAASVMSP